MLYLTAVRAGADPGGNRVILAAFHQLSAVVAVHAVPFDRDCWHRVSPGDAALYHAAVSPVYGGVCFLPVLVCFQLAAPAAGGGAAWPGAGAAGCAGRRQSRDGYSASGWQSALALQCRRLVARQADQVLFLLQ